MLRLILAILLRRLIVVIPMLLVVSVMIFVILRLLPVDPIAMIISPTALPHEVEATRAFHGLDKPIPVQYLIWIGNVFSGDFGNAISFRVSVLNLVSETLPATIELALFALFFAVIIGFGAGLYMFHVRGTVRETVTDVFSIAMLSFPDFLWALILILLVGVQWAILPFTGRYGPEFIAPDITGFIFLDAIITADGPLLWSALGHIILPALALALAFAPLIMRVLKSSLTEVMTEDYITLARLRGISEWRILLRHALKNGVLPTLTLVGVQFGFLFGGTLLVDIIFAYPGLGNLMVRAIRNTDLPVIQMAALTYCVVVLASNTVVDVLYVVLNPKLRKE